MNRSEITELHYISPLANLPSIIQFGILSHKRAQAIGHQSVAMEGIQERRKNKHVPNDRELHEYTNLYFDAHNPMLSKVRTHNDKICILRIDALVLDLPGVIIADCNAASGWARFSSVADGIVAIDRDRVFARYWTHPEDPLDEPRHKLEKCAEVLVPDYVEARYLVGVYVATEAALSRLQQLNIALPVSIKRDIFF